MDEPPVKVQVGEEVQASRITLGVRRTRIVTTPNIQFDSVDEMQHFDYSHCKRGEIGLGEAQGTVLRKSLEAVTSNSSMSKGRILCVRRQ